MPVSIALTKATGRRLPKAEPDGMFKMRWVVPFEHELTPEVKAKLDNLVKTHQDENNLMISQIITGEGAKPVHICWRDCFLSTEVEYDTENKKVYIEFLIKSKNSLWKDMMVMFLREIRNLMPTADVRID